MFPGETFFKNAFESCSDWNVVEFRDQQVIYSLTIAEATAMTVKEVLRMYEGHSMQLSIMVTVYPRRAISTRVDDLLEKAAFYRETPKWYEERKWPRA